MERYTKKLQSMNSAVAANSDHLKMLTGASLVLISTENISKLLLN